jgi:beta-alanine--pyruvate transaminase
VNVAITEWASVASRSVAWSTTAVFSPQLPGTDHLRHTHDIARNAFTKGGLPAHGAELADDLERLVGLHGAETIAAVIVEPVAGSTGVLLPPEGYLKRLREIADKHGILVIFDEVISGFGRLGAPFAVDYFGVTPDIITTAKGLTNGVVPRGAVFTTSKVHDALMRGPEAASNSSMVIRIPAIPSLVRQALRHLKSTVRKASDTCG